MSPVTFDYWAVRNVRTDGNFRTGKEVRFPHAHWISGKLSERLIVAAGTNAEFYYDTNPTERPQVSTTSSLIRILRLQ